MRPDTISPRRGKSARREPGIAEAVLAREDVSRFLEGSHGLTGDAARTRVTGGADFATIAKEYSEDPGSKDRGGDLGFFPRAGAMVEPFARQ